MSPWTDRCPANAPLLCIQGRWGPTPAAIISPVFPHAGWPEWPPQPENPLDPFILPEPPSFPNTSTFPAWLSDDVQAKLAGSPIKTLASEVPSVTKKKTSADSAVKVNRRNTQTRRTTEDRRKKDVEVPVERRQSDRRKVQRRRQIDPTTCERDYTNDEIEFMHALDEYKRASGRMFPTCSEILEVVRNLGYQKVSGIVQPDVSLASVSDEFGTSQPATLEIGDVTG